jgi:SSS family solute:Na+ symporter
MLTPLIGLATTPLDTGDWVVIVLYLVGIILIGAWFGRDQKNTRDYFLGSKDIPWWGIGLSIVAAETSALTIIGVPAIAYGNNLSFIQLIIGYVIARIILAVVMVPHYLKGEIYSPYELFSRAFGAPARKLAGAFFLISETLAAGVRVYVACIPIRLMMGSTVFSFGGADPIISAIILFVLLSLFYTYIGGVKAVIWTDAIQFILFLGGGIFTLFYIPHLVNGGTAEIIKTASKAGKLNWFVSGFSWEMPINIWMGIIGGTFMVLSSHGAEQLIVQRVLACKSVADGRRALTLSALVIFPLFLVFLFTGIFIWAFYQQRSMAIPLPESSPGIKSVDFIYPIFILTETPTYLRGFLIVAVLSAAMSSVSSALTSLSSVSTMDFAKEMMGEKKSESFYLRLSKASTLFWACFLVIVAYLSRKAPFVLDAAFKLRGLTSGALLGGLILVVWWKKGRPFPVIAGMCISLLVMIGISLWAETSTDQNHHIKVAGYWFTMVGAIVTVICASTLRLFLHERKL